MIIAITPNPALDITYTTPELAIGEVSRVEVRRRAGGKGINVARVLHQLGHPATAMGVLAGLHGQAIAQDVRESGLAARWSWQAGESRATVNVVTSDGNSTMLNEPGEQLEPQAFGELVDEVRANRGTGVATISGSLPPGMAEPQLDALLHAAREVGAVIADLQGPALLRAAEAGVDLLKPNRQELLAATGEADVEAAIGQVLARGAGAVALSLGEDGLRLAGEGFDARAWLDTPIVGNPTGAGDSVVAAFARALDQARLGTAGALRDPQWRVQALREAVALSAAAVAAPLAGEYDAALYEQLLQHVRWEEN